MNRRGRPAGQGRPARWLLRAAGVVGLLWFLTPLVPVVLWALADRWSYPALLPQDFGLRGWSTVASAATLRAIGTSAVLAASVAVAATGLGTAAGRAVGWRLTRRPVLAGLLLLAPVALPPFAIAMGLSSVVLRLRAPELIATVVILTVFALPYTSYVLASRYASLEPESEDQARMLGATRRQAFRQVTLPALRPAITAAAFLAFLVGWTDYVVTVVIGGGRLVTLPMLIGGAVSGSGNEPTVAALSLVSVLPPLLALLLARVVTSGRPRAIARPGVDSGTAIAAPKVLTRWEPS